MKTNVVFLNQYAGPLFRELVEDLAQVFGDGTLFTGHTDEIEHFLPGIAIIRCPDQRTESARVRLTSWLSYVFSILPGLWRLRKAPLLFIVSNPPILPWVGYLARRLWGQKYVLLIYDVYPDMLVRFAGLSEHSLVVRLWRWFNKKSFEHAEAVIAIGEYMAQLLDTAYDPTRTTAGKTLVISNWADGEVLKPLAKNENWFAKKFDQVDRLTILYAGTLGLKHNVNAMVQSAPRLQLLQDVHFMFIGRGAGYEQVATMIATERLTNTTLMPFLSEKDLPYSLAVGDVAVIAVDRGGHGVYVPGKTYYAMAVGSALLVLSEGDNEVTDMVKKHRCGLVVRPDDVDGFVNAVSRFREDRIFLEDCRRNSRRAMELHYSRKVCTQQYIEALKGLGL